MKLSLFSSLSLIQTIKINSLLALLWWISFLPGFYSGDSFAVIDMAKSGNLTSEWTYAWAVFTDFLTIHGQHPELATLFYSQAFAFAISTFSFELLGSKNAALSSIILVTTPLIGAMGITLWHDIPMTTGFMLTIVGAGKLIKKDKVGVAYSMLGLLLSAFRYNGLPTILFFLLVLWLFFERSRQVLIVIVTCLLLLLITTLANSKFQNSTNVQSQGFFDWMYYDLSCYAAEYKDKNLFSDNFGPTTTVTDWESSSACHWFNDSKVKSKQLPIEKMNVFRAWKQLFFSKPSYTIALHMKRHQYLLPVPIYGFQRVPFLHTNIEFHRKDISARFPEVYEVLRLYPRTWNFLSFIFAQAGFWTLISFVLSLLRKERIWYMTCVLSVILILGLFIFAPIPDARFALFALISGQLSLLHFLLSAMDKGIKWK